MLSAYAATDKAGYEEGSIRQKARVICSNTTANQGITKIANPAVSLIRATKK